MTKAARTLLTACRPAWTIGAAQACDTILTTERRERLDPAAT